MIVTHEFDPDRELTPQQVEELKELENWPITFDEDCPELTEEQLKQFKRVNDRHA